MLQKAQRKILCKKIQIFKIESGYKDEIIL